MYLSIFNRYFDWSLLWYSAILDPSAELTEQAGRRLTWATGAMAQAWSFKEAVVVPDVRGKFSYGVVVLLAASGGDNIIGLSFD